MKKTNLLRRFFLLSIGLLLFASNNYTTTTIAQDKITPSIVLRADSIKIILPCMPGVRSRSNSCSDDQVVDLIAEIKDSPDGSNWSYRYEVSGGRIIGSGAKVKIDLSGIKPGTYTVTVYATTSQKEKTDEVVISATISISVESCPDCYTPHICPKISIESSENPIKAGTALIFTGLVEPEGNPLYYKWTVSAGTIVEGQGTKIIEVDTSGLAAGQELTATLEIGGPWEWCNKIASSSVKIK